MREYERIFDWYIATRNPSCGVSQVAEFAACLAPHSTLLDVGCGDGIPISRYLVAQGHSVFGIDSSPKMIEAFRKNFPTATAECASIAEARLTPGAFDAAIAWGVLFHLPEDEQQRAVANVAAALRHGGRFLFTSGEEHGTRDGRMDGVDFHYVSLGSEGYARLLRENGMRLLSDFYDDSQNYYYVAEKTQAGLARP